MTRLALAALVVTASLAGCLGDEGTGGSPMVPSAGEARVAASTLEPGRWFAFQLETGSGARFDFTTVVVEDGPDAWRLHTDDPLVAVFESVFDIMLLGSFARDDLTTVWNDEPFTLYEFPLVDGGRWRSSMVHNGEVSAVTHTARYEPAIETRAGPMAGFEVLVTLDDGTPAARYDHLIETGWTSSYVRLDENADPPGSEVLYRYDMTAWGEHYEGEFVTADVELLLSHTAELHLDPADPRPGPAPGATFEVPASADRVFLLASAASTDGTLTTSLVDPMGERYEASAQGVPGDDAARASWLVDAVPGTWEALFVGAGRAASGSASAWAVHETVAAVP